MRWRLLLITSVLAALLSAGASIGVSRFLSLKPGRLTNTTDLFVIGALLVPFALITFASIFVYRHTAKRRPLQALATALLSASLTLAFLYASSFFLARTAPFEPNTAPAPSPNNIG